MPHQFPPEFRQRALRMLEEALPGHESEYAAICHVGGRLGVGPETLRKWRRRPEIDDGKRPGVTPEELAEIRRLKREVAELRRANEILRTASAYFAAEPGRPRDEMIRCVNAFRDRFGVEAICRILGAAECGFLTARRYRAALARPPSARRLRDELPGTEIARLHAENYGVYGVRTMHALLRRPGWMTGRDQTARLMRDLGLRGVKRARHAFTTRPDPAAARPADLVRRQFTAARTGDRQPRKPLGTKPRPIH
jgi:transposase-like protein